MCACVSVCASVRVPQRVRVRIAVRVCQVLSKRRASCVVRVRTHSPVRACVRACAITIGVDNSQRVGSPSATGVLASVLLSVRHSACVSVSACVVRCVRACEARRCYGCSTHTHHTLISE